MTVFAEFSESTVFAEFSELIVFAEFSRFNAVNYSFLGLLSGGTFA